jgi:ABC-type Fe3+ transport system permease subunit
MGITMITSPNDFDEKSDAELLAISNGNIPFGMLSGKSTTTREDIITQAKIVLHKRQKKSETSLKEMTLWILILTAAIAIFTAILVYFSFSDRWGSKHTSVEKSSVTQPRSEHHTPIKVNNTEKDNQ